MLFTINLITRINSRLLVLSSDTLADNCSRTFSDSKSNSSFLGIHWGINTLAKIYVADPSPIVITPPASSPPFIEGIPIFSSPYFLIHL